MTESRETKQLRLIREVMDALHERSIPCWLRGGWAMDFFLGDITRPHADIDLFVWARNSDEMAALLSEAGLTEVAGPPTNTQRNFEKDGELLHIVLLEKTDDGKLITPGGRWGQAAEQAPEEWPAGMLDWPRARLGDITATIVSPDAQIHEKEAAARVPGHPMNEKARADIERLRLALRDGSP